MHQCDIMKIAFITYPTQKTALNIEVLRNLNYRGITKAKYRDDDGHKYVASIIIRNDKLKYFCIVIYYRQNFFIIINNLSYFYR